MCGICGKINFCSAPEIETQLLQRMMDVMAHRGPDAQGTFIAPGIALGHLRLSIIDVNSGSQPISNEDNTVHIIFNGEIYNFQELRKSLLAKGHLFTTKTDTEVILHLYEEKGERCLDDLRGMFAFAIWDEKKKKLFIARDRVGIKPLYYCATPSFFSFASEIKSLFADPLVIREIDLDGALRFLCYMYTPGEKTLYKNIMKLKPGHYLVVENGRITEHEYWDLTYPETPRDFTLEEAAEELDQLLSETVRDHIISDVPIGFLLSGGIDSTGILSYALEHTEQEISSFTIGFDGHNFADERPYARMAADLFGSTHYEISMTADDFINFLPGYIWHMEEPVREPPAIALYYVSKLASEHVKVLLSGEGGDEAFAGYQNYRSLVGLERLKRICGPLKGTVGQLFRGLKPVPVLKKLARYSPYMKATFPDYYYSRTATPFSYLNNPPREIFAPAIRDNYPLDQVMKPMRDLFSRVDDQEVLNQMLYCDTKTWLPDNLLIKADKITMANSVELRVPLLDHKVLEFAASLPPNFKLRGFDLKSVLKKTLSKRIPTEIIKRKKTGFPVPYESWMRNEMRGLVSDVLLDHRALQRGYFEKSALEKMLADNNSGKDYSREIFSLLVFELCHRIFIDGEAVSF